MVGGVREKDDSGCVALHVACLHASHTTTNYGHQQHQQHPPRPADALPCHTAGAPNTGKVCQCQPVYRSCMRMVVCARLLAVQVRDSSPSAVVWHSVRPQHFTCNSWLTTAHVCSAVCCSHVMLCCAILCSVTSPPPPQQVRSLLVVSKVIHLLLAMLAPQVRTRSLLCTEMCVLDVLQA